MHPVGLSIVHLDRQEGPRADMQGQRLVADARCLERGKQFGGEVQRGSRRCDRPVLGREHRLIVALVLRIGWALARDIGRQRHLARAFEQDFDRFVAEEREGHAAVISARLDQRLHPSGEIDRVAKPQPLGVADEGLPAAQVDPFMQRCADFRFTPAALELGGNHAGIVEHQHIASAQQPRQVAHRQVLKRARSSHQQQPRRIARTRRAQGYPFWRKLEIEQVNAHAVWG